MIKKIFYLFCIVITISCSNIELVLKESDSTNPYKNGTSVAFDGERNEKFAKELFSFFGSDTENKYILTTSFVEKKENRLVKVNQVAEKIDYKISIGYKLYYIKKACEVFNKKMISNFSFTPKAFGYNFGTDRSLEELYKKSIRSSIQNFINLAPKDKKPLCI